MTKKQSIIRGIGTWLPDTVRYNKDWPATFGQEAKKSTQRTFNDIQKSSDPESARITARDLELESQDPFLGCVERRVADPSVRAADVESHAAKIALEEAGIKAKDIDLVICNSAVPDRISPTSAGEVSYQIGAHSAMTIGIDNGCASGIVQLQMAHAYLKSGLAKNILLTQSHLMTKTLLWNHPASPGLGDGASAYVLSNCGEGLKIKSVYGITHGEYFDAVSWVRHDENADNPDAPWWDAGGSFRPGSKNLAHCKYLMQETVSFGAKTIASAAKLAKIDIKDINTIVSVQPRGFLPHAMAERLGLSRDTAVTTYNRLGHLGTAGPVFNLLEARNLNKLGNIIALYGQGVGFTRISAIITK